MTDEQKARVSAGQMGRIESEEQRAKISASLKGRPTWSKGIPMSEETKAKISATEKGKVVSPETRAKMSKAQSNQSEETRKKIATALWMGGKAIWKRRSRAIRRNLGFIPLNVPFIGCEGHHVGLEQIIFLPKALHKSLRHSIKSGKNMAQINAVAYNFLFKQEVEAAMSELSLAEAA